MRATGSPRVPWRNGGGWTRPLAQWPEQSDLDEFAWRVSCAEIEAPGPFSTFPGVERQLMVVAGDALSLTVDGDRHDLGREQTLRFSGDAEVSCRLVEPSPVVALNVMTRPGSATASMVVQAVDAGLVLAAPPEGHLVAFTLGSGTLVGDGGDQLGRFEAVWCAAGEQVSVGGYGQVAVIAVQPDQR